MPIEGIRYQVFVSSTFLDLQEERAAVVSALLQLEAFPAGMELFPAADDDAWTLIKRVIDSSDYYLLVIGGKYGSVDPETEISYTEKEFDYAVGARKPVMAFLHEDPSKIELGKSEKNEAAQEKLAAFRDKVQATKHVKYWSGSADLAGKVALSFANFRQTYPAVGWVRGDVGTSAEALGEINDLRKQLDEAEARTELSTGPPSGVEDLAQGEEYVGFLFVVKSAVRLVGQEASESTDYTRYIRPKVSWDSLFSAVGPEMLNEADERLIRKRIDTWLRQEFLATAKKEVRKAAAEGDEKIARFKRTSISINDENFGTLLVQFRALGLIERSVRPRSVKDNATYWALTSYGDSHLTALRAIRRSEEESPSSGVTTTFPAFSPPEPVRSRKKDTKPKRK